MNCQHVRPLLDDYAARRIPPLQQDAVARHLRECTGCRAALEEARLLQQRLRDLPVPPPRPGFEDRAFARLDRQETARRPLLPAWLAAGLGAAVAATLVLWLAGAGPWGRHAGDAIVATVQVPAGQVHRVRLVFHVPAPLENATLALRLPDNVELAGQPGRRELRWSASLRPGANRLELPLRARGPGRGTLTAAIENAGHSRRFGVIIETAAADTGPAPDSPPQDARSTPAAITVST